MFGAILLVNRCFAVLDDDHLLQKFVFLVVENFLDHLFLLLLSISKVKIVLLLCLVDDLLLIVLGVFEFLAELFEFDFLFAFGEDFLVLLVLHVVGLVLQDVQFVLQLDQLSVRDLHATDVCLVLVGLLGEAVLRLPLGCLQRLVLLPELVNALLVLLVPLGQFVQVLPVFDLVKLLLEADHFLLRVLEQLLRVLDLVQLVRDVVLLLLALEFLLGLLEQLLVVEFELPDLDGVVLVDQDVDGHIQVLQSPCQVTIDLVLFLVLLGGTAVVRVVDAASARLDA